MAQNTGFLRGVAKENTPLATPEARAIKSATAGNPGKVDVPHSTASMLDKSVTATRAIPATAGAVRKIEQPKPPARPLMKALD